MKTVIWDYNGTIVDDIGLCLKIENRMLKERNNPNYPVSLDKYRSLFGFPVIDYYYKIGYTFETESFAEVSDEFHRYYSEGFDECGLVPGFEEKIHESISRGYHNVILSAARQDKLIEQCQKLGISGYFEEILGISDLLANSKVDMAKDWMRRTSQDPAECMLIGDTLHDMETAVALGIENYTLVPTGHQSFDVLRAASEKAVGSLFEVVL